VLERERTYVVAIVGYKQYGNMSVIDMRGYEQGSLGDDGVNGVGTYYSGLYLYSVCAWANPGISEYGSVARAVGQSLFFFSGEIMYIMLV